MKEYKRFTSHYKRAAFDLKTVIKQFGWLAMTSLMCSDQSCIISSSYINVQDSEELVTF